MSSSNVHYDQIRKCLSARLFSCGKKKKHSHRDKPQEVYNNIMIVCVGWENVLCTLC